MENNKNKSTTNWTLIGYLITFFFGFIGLIIYYFLIKDKFKEDIKLQKNLQNLMNFLLSFAIYESITYALSLIFVSFSCFLVLNNFIGLLFAIICIILKIFELISLICATIDVYKHNEHKLPLVINIIK